MPWRIQRSSQFFDKEILKYAQDLDAFPTESVVLDANAITMASDPNVRTVVPAGTILKLHASYNDKVVPYAGSGTILGILAKPIDIGANITAGNQPAPMYNHGVVFATASIVGFTSYASALISTLTTCKFK